MNALRALKMACLASALAAAPLTSSAAVMSFTTEFSGSGATCANTTCATTSLVQNGSNVDFVLTANLTGGEFITGLYGNWDPFQFATSHFSFSNDGGTGESAAQSLSAGEDQFKADGDGYFDWVFNFNTGAGNRLDGSDTYTWTFTNALLGDILDAVSVNGPAGKNGFTFAIHVQGLTTGSGSGWFFAEGSDNTGEVPEPNSLALLGAGLAGLALIRRRLT